MPVAHLSHSTNSLSGSRVFIGEAALLYEHPYTIPPPCVKQFPPYLVAPILKSHQWCSIVLNVLISWNLTHLSLFWAGRAYSRTLQQAAVPLLPKRFCKERYKGLFTGRMLCAGNLQENNRVDSCQGDSGGPLMCERPDETWVVYGVTSWGYGCGVKDTPGVYTRVPAFVPWIKSITRL